MRLKLCEAMGNCVAAVFLVLLFALQGCAGGLLEDEGVDANGIIDPSGSLCRGLKLDHPSQGAFIAQSEVLVKGQITARTPIDLVVDGIDIQTEDGSFEVILDKADGAHTIEIACDLSMAKRTVLVASSPPKITIETPVSGALIGEGAMVEVVGYVDQPQILQSLQVNDQPVTLDANGRFRIQHRPSPGMNHLEVLATTLGGDTVDLRRSFLYGQFTAWDDSASALLTADVRATALTEVSNIIERRLTAEAVQEIVSSQLGSRGKIRIRQIKYDSLELDFELRNGQVGVLLRLNKFAINVKYRKNTFIKASGWVRSDPVEVRADLILDATPEGSYDLRVENPSVSLARFDLDLSGFLSIIESLVEPLVEDIAHDTLLDALEGIVVADLLEANLLEQEVEILGQTTALNLTLDQLQVTPNGIGLQAHAKLEPFAVVYDAPGFWTSSPVPLGDSGEAHLALGMSIDLFNRVLGEAWRGGLLDADLAGLVGDSNPLSIGILTGVVGPELVERFDPASAVQIDTKALMQPVVTISDPATGQLRLELAALQVTLSSEDADGQRIPWATLEFSADLRINPRFDNGAFTLDAELRSRVELVDAPLFPIKDGPLETFLETIIDGVSGGTLSGLVDSAFRFSDINVLGVGVGDVSFGSTARDPGFLVFGINLAEAN